jgi:hypothetical protein
MKYLKHYLLLTLAFVACTLSAQMTAEQKAIKQVIEDETKHWYAQDYDAWAASWVHSPAVYWSVTGPDTYMKQMGWDALKAFAKATWESEPASDGGTPAKTDFAFDVQGNMAFVTFKEDGNMSTRVLKKQDGKWKLLNVGVVLSKSYEVKKQKDALHALNGVWELDAGSVELSDDKWSLDQAKFKVKQTATGAKMYMTSDWSRNDGFTGTWEDHCVVASDTEAGKYGFMVNTTGPYGSSVITGELYFKDEYIAFKGHKLGADNVVKQKFALKDDNHLKVHNKYMDADGNVEWEMSFVLVKDQDASLVMN